MADTGVTSSFHTMCVSYFRAARGFISTHRLSGLFSQVKVKETSFYRSCYYLLSIPLNVFLLVYWFISFALVWIIMHNVVGVVTYALE